MVQVRLEDGGAAARIVVQDNGRASRRGARGGVCSGFTAASATG